MKAWMILGTALLAVAQTASAPDADTDHDRLSDYAELHKYCTDPHKASTAGGIADGDWDQRKEFTYTITSVLQLAKPYRIADMNDDYQDARLISEEEDSATVEVVYYPLNTNRQAIGENPHWRRDYAGMKQYLDPTVTENWDTQMRADLVEALRSDGIDPDKLTDREVAAQVSRWVMKHTRTIQPFAIWYVNFPGGEPAVFPSLREPFDRQKIPPSLTDRQMIEQEVLGRSMFYQRVHGTCTSTAVLMATVMRALGLPTRIVFTVPPLDANDPAQREMFLSALHHHQVRATIARGLPETHASHAGFANHVFNEVFVGNRWVRLNYDRLGQNNFGPDYFGLLTHVYTTDSLSHVSMPETWGRRIAFYPKVGPKLSSVNPYRLLKVSDHFGKYAQIPNPEVPQEKASEPEKSAGRDNGPPSFEAASVKPNKSGSSRSRWDSKAATLVIENKPLRDMIAIAYNVTGDRVTGGPGWISSDCFDIHAKAAGRVNSDELLEMLRALLAERFHLTVHGAKISGPGYSLTQLKGGIRIKPSQPDGHSGTNNHTGTIAAQNITMQELARHLTRILGDPVDDDTGLAGVYSFTLDWPPDDSSGLQDALAAKLGLQLESKKTTVDTVIVDRAEKPSGNGA